MFEPTKADKFAFGLWTVGNRGADPFGPAVRPPVSPITSVERLSKLGAWGVALHDNDLVPFGSSPKERDKIVGDFKKALKDNGMVVSMATCNLFSNPVFKDGALTSTDPEVRKFALAKSMKAIDLGIELGAKIFVMWGGREGAESDASKCAVTALKRYREGINFLTHYVKDQKYDIKFAIEAKANEPRGDIYLSTNGSVLAFIETLDHPELVGVNPETAHETMAGLNFYHVVAQAIECGKLFHIDLNAQKIGRYDQDLRFGSEDIRNTFFVVKLLEESGYTGVKHFDAHAYRTEDQEGVWDFAAGCMRTYKILQAKAREFAADKELQALLPKDTTSIAYSSKLAAEIKSKTFDTEKIAAKGLQYEKIDQLFMELLMGVRTAKAAPAKPKKAKVTT
jgi:xylose isomerase